MKERYTILLSAILGVAIIALGVLYYETSAELKAQKELVEQQGILAEQRIALIALTQKVPASTLEGFTQVDKIYIAQGRISEGSSHLFAFIGGQWFDLGEGQITQSSENQTGGKEK